MSTFHSILKDLQAGTFAPIYAFHGEESYFIDELVQYIEEHALPEQDRAFNQTIIYGTPDLDHRSVLDNVMRYPMMAEKQLVVLKEAQQMKQLAQLESYINKPLSTTIFVIAHKHKKIPANTKFGKLLKKSSVWYHAEALRDYQVPEWIQQYAGQRGVKIDPKAALLLEQQLGSDLSKIVKSVDKILLNLKGDTAIQEKHIEKYIGISREYNAFELNDAIMERNATKANKMVAYFKANPKAGVMPIIVASVFPLFHKLYLMHGTAPMGDKDLASTIGIPFFLVRKYNRAKQLYSRPQVEQAIGLLSEYDLRSKGVDNGSASHGALIQELVWKLLNL